MHSSCIPNIREIEGRGGVALISYYGLGGGCLFEKYGTPRQADDTILPA